MLTHQVQPHHSPPVENEVESESGVYFALLPSDAAAKSPVPFALSDPAEYAHVFRELKEGGHKSPERMVVEYFSGFTFLLRITFSEASGEIVVELIAVFEGNLL